jgi:hypothetical protein
MSLFVASVLTAALAVGAFACGASTAVGREALDDAGTMDAAQSDGIVGDVERSDTGAPADAYRPLDEDAAADSAPLTEDASEAGLFTAPNSSCESAAEIIENAAGVGNAATVFGDLADGAPAPFPLACSSTTELGNILYYHANVAADRSLVANARRSDLGEPLPIRIANNCASRQCVADGVGQVRYSNTGASTIDVVIEVGSGGVSGPLPFELQIAIELLGTR